MVRAVSFDPLTLDLSAVGFLTERHLATLSVARSTGRVHVSPVGFTFDPDTGIARVITSATARKTVHALAAGRVSLCQVDGGRWLTLEGPVRVSSEADEVIDAEARYTARYQTPRPNPNRVALVVQVDRIYGRV
jgi:F420H(2)-dependent biliverdin reductase